MNRRADILSTSGVVVPMRIAPARKLAQGFIVPIADRVAGIMFDEASAPTDDRPRLTGFVEGEPVSRPVVSTCLPLRAGGRRHLLLVGRSAGSLNGRNVTLALGPEIAAAIDPEWLQPPLTDGTALIEGLSDAGRRRLLKLFLTTGASLFGFGGGSEFSRAAHRLLDLLGVLAVEPASWCPVGTAGHILTYRMPGEVDAARIGTLVALSSGKVTRLTGCALVVEPLEHGRLLHVHVPQALPAGWALVGLGAAPVHLSAPEAGAGPQALVPWLARRDAGTRAWVQALIETAAGPDPVAAALMREVCHQDEPPPALAIRHLSATPEGVLHSLSLNDPHDLVRAVRIERGGAAQDMEPVRGTSAVQALVGYAAVARQSRFDDRYRIRLIYRSGRAQTVAEGSLQTYRGDIPECFATGRNADAAAGIARARLSLDRPARVPATETFGTPPRQPTLSVIAAVGDNLDLIRARAAMLFAEPGSRGVELIYHLADGPAASGALAAIADTTAVFGVPHRLVTLPEGADATDRLLAALGEARGATALVLGADVLPADPGWLAPWLCRLGDRQPILGATLLDHAGAVIDAGGAVGQTGRRHVGLPADDLPRTPTAETALVSVDCVGLTRAATELIRASATRYPNPDVMLAEAVQRLQRDGKQVATMLRCRFVRYAETPVHPLREAADTYALELVLKCSFSPSGDDMRT